MRISLSLTSALLLIALTAGPFITATAYADPKTKPAAADAGTPEEQLAKLLAQREALAAKLKVLQKEFQTADEERQAEIRVEFEKLIEDFRTKTFPKLAKVALPIYLKDGENQEAEEIVLGELQELFVQNKYAEVVALCDKLQAAGRVHPAILNFSGVSHFATQDFAKAQELLEQAQEAGGQIFEQLGARYLDVCEDYIKFWEKEVAIRKKEAAAPEGERNPVVLFKTTKGNIELELFENEAPNTVANFISLVEAKKYDKIVFHRVIPNFMAQGGDPNTLDDNPQNDGQGGPGYNIACECYRPDTRLHFQGSLSMAHAGRDTGGSQFFLTHLPTAHLNGKHTVFGRIVKGMDVAASLVQGDKILSATVVSKRNHPYVPKTMPE